MCHFGAAVCNSITFHCPPSSQMLISSSHSPPSYLCLQFHDSVELLESSDCSAGRSNIFKYSTQQATFKIVQLKITPFLKCSYPCIIKYLVRGFDRPLFEVLWVMFALHVWHYAPVQHIHLLSQFDSLLFCWWCLLLFFKVTLLPHIASCGINKTWKIRVTSTILQLSFSRITIYCIPPPTLTLTPLKISQQTRSHSDGSEPWFLRWCVLSCRTLQRLTRSSRFLSSCKRSACRWATSSRKRSSVSTQALLCRL